MARIGVKKRTSSLTLGQLILAETALHRLASQPLPVKTAYHVGRLVKKVQEETATFQEQRNAFIKELGEERDVTPEEAKQGGVGKVLSVTPANTEEFGRRMKDLGDIEVKITEWLLTVELLGDLKVTPIDMVLLDPLFAPAP